MPTRDRRLRERLAACLAEAPDVVRVMLAADEVPGGGAGRERRLLELDWADDGSAAFAGIVRKRRPA